MSLTKQHLFKEMIREVDIRGVPGMLTGWIVFLLRGLLVFVCRDINKVCSWYHGIFYSRYTCMDGRIAPQPPGGREEDDDMHLWYCS